MVKKALLAAVIWMASFNILVGAAVADTAAPTVNASTIWQLQPEKVDCRSIRPSPDAAKMVNVKKPEVAYQPQGPEMIYLEKPAKLSLAQRLGDQIERWIRWAAQKVGIRPSWLKAVALAESGGNQNAVSPCGAVGIMQLMPETAKALGVNPYRLQENILGGAMYLRQQLDEFGTLPLALAAYNAGPGAVRQYRGIPPFKETVDYVARVIAIIGGGA